MAKAKQYVNHFIWIGPLISLLFLLLVDLDPGHPEVTRTAAVAILMAIWWITEIISLGVTALLPLILFPVFHILPAKEVAPTYFNSIVLLFMGAFIVALAMEKWELHRRIGLKILSLLGKSGSGIILGFMLTTAFLSMWISNTATAMIMVPIALAVILKLEETTDKDRLKGFTVALLWMTRADIQLGAFTLPGWAGLFPDSSFVDDSTVAITMAFLLFLVPARDEKASRIMDWETARRLPWSIILLFGGGFALAKGMKSSGLSLWIGQQLHGLGDVSPILIVLAIATLVVFLTELTSNTATTQMILPIMASVAGAIQASPLLLMIPATLAASFAFMLPVATPPNAVVFGTHRLKVYQMARIGIIMNIIAIGLILLGVFLLGKPVFGM